MRPGIYNLVVTFLVGDETHTIFAGNAFNLFVTLTDKFLFLLRNDNITQVEGQTTLVGKTIAQILDAIQELTSSSYTNSLDNICDNATQRLLGDYIIEITDLNRDNLVGYDTSNRSLNHSFANSSIFQNVIHHHTNWSMNVNTLLVICNDCLLWPIKLKSAALCTRTKLGDII